MKITVERKQGYRIYTREDGEVFQFSCQWRGRGSRRRQSAARVLLRWRKKKRPQGTRYTVHFPGSRKYGTGPKEWERTIKIVTTDDAKGKCLIAGPVFIDGERKLKCNIRDNEAGLWVRVDYCQLVHDGIADGGGKIICYQRGAAEAVVHCEDSEETEHPGFRRHRFSQKLEALNMLSNDGQTADWLIERTLEKIKTVAVRK